VTDELSTCDCCQPPNSDPVSGNRPGLPAIAYRVATQPTSLARMLELLGGSRPGAGLAGLTTRRLDDPAIAMLDAFAVLADVLSFYSERAANEGYLRTATERFSLLELAREIGYELRPGVAASAYLAFNVEDRLTAAASTTGAAVQATVAAGTQIQSVPVQGQLPQTFETGGDLAASADFNQLTPRQTKPQTLDAGATELILAGTTTGLKPGDLLLLAQDDGRGNIVKEPTIARVKRLAADTDPSTTTVELQQFGGGAPGSPDGGSFHRGTISIGEIELSGSAIEANIASQSWSNANLTTFLRIQGWPLEQVVAFLAVQQQIAPPPPVDAPSAGVFALRQQTAAFGHNAPNSAQLKASGSFNPAWDDTGTHVSVATNDSGTPRDANGRVVYLDNRYPAITAGSWATFVNAAHGLAGAASFWVAETTDLSAAEFAISGSVTALTLQKVVTDTTALKNDTWGFRSTAIHAQSDQLTLAEVPDPSPITGTSFELDRLVLGLDGRTIVLTGERTDLPGVTVSEAAGVRSSLHEGGFTTVQLTSALAHDYVRSTVHIAANVVDATNGATVTQEVLGGSDGSANQRFKLRKPPLTYTSADVAGGAASSLRVWVSGIEWSEAPSLYALGPTSRSYIVRRDDDGTTWVIFGDGIRGARPPSGAENIRADYRSGIGSPGLVGPGALTLMSKRPYGIRDVTNPMPAAGAADPEARDDARHNAPLTVLTLDRVVSAEDYGAFAAAFAGIGKAVATPLWLGQQQIVHITVAGVDGADVPGGSDLRTNLVTAISAAHDPGRGFVVDAYALLYFDLFAEVLIASDRDSAAVIAAVQAALSAAFSFAARDFGEPVAHSDVIAVVLAVPGVLDATITALALVGDSSGPAVADLLVALPARPRDPSDPHSAIDPAQLLVLSPVGAAITERTDAS
jgi:predicted phage baseplate assembly protein